VIAHAHARAGRRLVTLGIATAMAACARGEQQIPPMRLWTRDLAVRVIPDPVPPPAREAVKFRVEVRDKSSGQPIEGGEGRIYATSLDGVNAWDGLTPGPQPGTYFGRLEFITAGDWAMGLQFRRDSTQPLETMDWRQQVMAAHNETP
jgi:hypothetical protein